MKKLVNKSGRLPVIIFSALAFLASCNKDDDNGANANVQQIVGSYNVEDTDEYDEKESYSIGIAKSDKGGSNLEITNFGNIMYVPVKASIKGNTLTIPAQTFVGKKVTITISGQGTMTNNQLTFDYVIDTKDGYVFEHTCMANKIQ